MSFTETVRRLSGQAALLLGWRPDAFWRATPDELADALGALAALTPGGGEGGMDRAALGQLMEQYPDG